MYVSGVIRMKTYSLLCTRLALVVRRSTTPDAEITQIGSDIEGESVEGYSGHSVSLSSDGTRVAIGAPGNDGNGKLEGRVRVYKLENGAWTQIGSDIDGEAAGDESGHSVSLSSDGTRVAIGAPGNDGNGNYAGHVRVYKLENGAWTQIGSDIDGEAAGDESGYSVSLSSDGTRVAVGAPDNDGNGNYAGHVRVYKLENGAWTQIGSDIDGEAVGDFSGYSVSLSSDGTRVAVGAPYNGGNGTNAGHVRVYKLENGAWTQIGSDIDGEAAGDESGWSVSLSSNGTRVAVGAHKNDNSNGINVGHVRVYKLENGAWTQIGGDIDGEAAYDKSGYSVSLSSDGTQVAVGARDNDRNENNAVHVREKTFSGYYYKPVNPGSGTTAGHVRVYKLDNGAWTQIGSDIDGEAAGDNSGTSVSLSSDGTRVAVGTPHNGGNGILAGHVRVFRLFQCACVCGNARVCMCAAAAVDYGGSGSPSSSSSP